MAASSSMLGRKTEQREISPQRPVVMTDPHNPKLKRVVPVVYYLSRIGQLEHPHFMEVSLSSSDGLFLTDVINRLNILRGKGMASMYSWSCKRSYKNGFVWHDLSENDLVFPAHGQEYVLKGSELPENLFSDTASPSPRRQTPPENRTTGGDDKGRPRAADPRRRYYSRSSIDFDKLSLTEVSTQTDDPHRRRLRSMSEDEIEISTPPSDSSPETVGILMKTSGRPARQPETVAEKGGRRSSVLMQLISCGATSFKDCASGKGLGVIGQYEMRVPRGCGTGGSGRGKLEGREYFSGSLFETKKGEFSALKRCTSYSGDR